MHFLNNLKIQLRLMLVAAVPTLGIIVLAGMLALTAYKHMTTAEKLKEISGIAPEITKVIHDLQKERGTTAGFLSTNDFQEIAGGKHILQELYKDSEKHRVELEEAYAQMHMEKFSEEFSELSNHVSVSLDEITEKRQKIIKREIGKKDAVTSYTRHIRELLDIVEYIASHSDDAKLTDKFAAYAALLEAQEAMGQERAAGAGALSVGAIEQASRVRLAELKGMEEAYLQTFEVYASKHEARTYKEIKNTKSWKRVNELRDLFLDENQEFRLFTEVTASQWFKTYTEAIDATAVLEGEIRDDIQHRVEYLRAEARSEMIFDIVLTLVQLLITIVLVAVIAKSITGPLSGLTDRMKKLADDDLNFDIPDAGKNNELADMAGTLSIFRENAEQIRAMEVEQERLKEQAEIEKQKAMNNLADSFHDRTADLISSLAMSSDSMQQTAQMMSAASEETSVSSSAVASAAAEADANVQTVASASEELAASSQEIAKQIADVATRSSTAANEAEQTSQAVNELEELAESIGDVVGAIKDIADQTNLLALNATIEAARAGDAGKGFAVVADEVKKLANETGQKTEEIDQRVNRIQEAISNSVTAMSRIIENVQQIDHATSSVAGAVEEQNAATSEIGRNVAQASSGTQQVSQNIGDVQSAASETGQASVDVLNSANELAEVSRGLQNEITSFLEEIRGKNGNESANDSATPEAIAAE